MTNVKHTLKSTVALIAGAAIAIGALSACNTIGGAGKDIKSGGKAIERAADTSK